jgi:NAD(P)-dependent dehydrogenase (short-subunit alcohol dehydrogenase family)
MAGAIVIGAGPGLGQSIAGRFAREGLPVAVLARRRETVDAAAATLERFGVAVLPLPVDTTDEAALRSALDAAANAHGAPDVVVYNAAIIQRDAPGDLPAQAQLDAWSVNVVGALTAATHVAPAMTARGNGSFIITGGMPEPVAQYLSLSLGKAGVRALAAMLHEYYGPAGMHVATVTVYGSIAPGTAFDPDEIAEHYWRLHRQPREAWQLEVRYSGEPHPAMRPS